MFLFARLAAEGRLEAVLADPRHPALDDLYAYAERETFRAWSADQRAAMAAAAAIPQATPAEVEAAAGKAARHALEMFAARAGPVELVDGRIVVSGFVAHAVRTGWPPNSGRPAIRRSGSPSNPAPGCAQRRSGFADDDPAGAVAELEALGPHAPGAAQSPATRRSQRRCRRGCSRFAQRARRACSPTAIRRPIPHPLLAPSRRSAARLPTDSAPE